MNTLFLLAAQFDSRPIIPLREIRETYFPHLSDDGKLITKIEAGDINLPLVRLDASSQKGQKAVGLADLALFLDGRMLAARQELTALRR